MTSSRRRSRLDRRSVRSAPYLGLIAGALLSVGLAGCRSPSFNSGISAQQEDKVGEWASAEIDGQYPDPPNPVASARVADISSRLLRTMDAHASSIHVTLLQEDLPEAYSLPGGWVYVTTGLTARLKSDDPLAAVIAHEIAHATAHHAAQELVATVGRDTFVDMLTQGKYDDLANVSIQLTHFSHSRREEDEADALGLALASRAGFAPQGLTEAITTLQAFAPPESAAWAHVHPNDKSRVERLEKSLNPASTHTGTDPIETNH